VLPLNDQTFFTFADEMPLEVVFDRNHVHITFFLHSVNNTKVAFKATAAYKISMEADGPFIERVRHVSIDSDDPNMTMDLREIATNSFNGFFPTEIFLDRLLTSRGGSLAILEELKLKTIIAAGSWLSVGFKHEKALEEG